MRDRMMWRGPFPDADPAPLPEAVAAVRSSLRLAWEADPTGLVLLFAVDLATTAADVAQLLASGRAVEAVVEGRRPGAQTRRLVLLGGPGPRGRVGEEPERRHELPGDRCRPPAHRGPHPGRRCGPGAG